MKKLKTIQTQEKLNEVYALGDPGNGNAHHRYSIKRTLTNGKKVIVGTIQFQDGARNEENSIPGVLDVDLLEIVRDRLEGFQSGPFACEDNLLALQYVRKALICLDMRVKDRIARKVLGENKK